jgi:hypothetical protein
MWRRFRWGMFFPQILLLFLLALFGTEHEYFIHWNLVIKSNIFECGFPFPPRPDRNSLFVAGLLRQAISISCIS